MNKQSELILTEKLKELKNDLEILKAKQAVKEIDIDKLEKYILNNLGGET